MTPSEVEPSLVGIAYWGRGLQVESDTIFTPIPGKMIQFEEHMFQMVWFNHQPEALFHLQ